jgi:hypothetical protein
MKWCIFLGFFLVLSSCGADGDPSRPVAEGATTLTVYRDSKPILHLVS